MQLDFINPPGLCPTFGWTHVVQQTGGRTVYISGQVGIDEKGQVIGKGDMKAQTEQTFKNLATALAAVGATFKDVGKTNLYVVGLKPEHVPIIRFSRQTHTSNQQEIPQDGKKGGPGGQKRQFCQPRL